MGELETVKFIKNHRDNWRELLGKEPYCLTIKEDDNYALLKYSQIDSDFKEQVVKECRGLIIDKNTIEPVALSFYKFFNVQETLADEINWNNCKVQEKIDGSKMLVWYNKYEDKWQVSTSGTLNAYEANVSDFGITFGELFDRACNNIFGVEYKGKEGLLKLESYLSKNWCYTFELVSPESRLVVPYKETKIYFIGVRNVNKDDACFFYETNPDVSRVCELIERPKEYPLTNLQECLDACDKMGFDEEGFVVVDNNWKRVKIKSPAFVAVFHMKDNGKPNKRRMIDLIETGEQSEFLSYFPEYKPYIDEVAERINNLINRIIDGMHNIDNQYEKNKDLSRKDIAIFITTNYKDISSFLFKYLTIRNELKGYYYVFAWEEFKKLQPNKKLEYLGYKEII